MSETKIQYLQGERESKIREHLRSKSTADLLELIVEESKLGEYDEFREMLIEFIIEKNYMELE